MATCHTYMSESSGTVTVNPSTGSLCSAFSSMVRARIDVAFADAIARRLGELPRTGIWRSAVLWYDKYSLRENKIQARILFSSLQDFF